jgi:uncharacterized protein YlxP (DUF503 family)
MHISALALELHLPGCQSLKEKRGRLKPLLAGIHKQYNVSAAEIERQDSHTESVVACVVVSNDGRQVDRVLSKLPGWIERRFPDVMVVDQHVMTL